MNDPSADFTVTHVRPYIHRQEKTVAAWEFKLHLKFDGATAMDAFLVGVPAGFRKPLAEWTRADLNRFIEAILREDPKAQKLMVEVRRRAEMELIADFDLDKMAA